LSAQHHLALSGELGPVRGTLAIALEAYFGFF